MKKIVLLFGAVAVMTFYSCSGNSAAANKMADEMCAAMEKYNENDMASMMEAANAMMEITKKEDEYKDVTEDQLQKAMEDKCPDGWAKFKGMTEGVK